MKKEKIFPGSNLAIVSRGAANSFISLRERILRSALKLFSTRGYFETHIPDIATDSKLGVGSIYRNFRNKNDLFNESFRRCIRNFEDRVIKDLDSERIQKKRFHLFWSKLTVYFKESSNEFIFIDRYANCPFLDAESEKLFYTIGQNLNQILQSENNSESKDLPIGAAMIGAFLGLVKFHFHKEQTLEENILLGTADAIWKGFYQEEKRIALV
ncbi:hypothetical protein CH373_17430 [Leptospira perolatii]|uniref:HTH tetR-type domain-containing protein n=1 Tax=Leptospira perolatii TaxID=2023191 RepID=A0A2M9ZID4_9LEPT|nr:TetR/AcrR family transcriptional regulator [Leptospira perolatii]PJZ68342.1 hypothetical protein CH360_16715 [Leptospira perolatii]PJZ71830.1 hypothetical protein CH373_17430 [Leptospira perolatii]